MKRRRLNQLSLFLLGMGISGCTRGSSEQVRTSPVAEPAASPVLVAAAPTVPQTKLKWMGHWWKQDQRETLVREVAQEFAFLNQDLDIELKFWQEIGFPGKPQVAKAIAEMIRSGNLKWDLIWLDDDIYALVAEELDDVEWGARHLVNFETVPGFAKTQKPFIVNDPSYQKQTGDILVGPYLEGYYCSLFYNQSLTQKIGIDIKQQGMTFDDLLGYVRAVNQYNQKQGSKIPAFYEAKDWFTLEYLFQNLIKSEIAEFDQTKAEVFSASKQNALLKTLEAFEALGRYQPLIPSHNENIWYDTRQLMLEDKAVFFVNGTWMYNHWRSLNQKAMTKIIPAELPVFQPVQHYVGGYIPTWAVMKDSPNRDRAIELMLFWSRPEVAEKWVRYTKNPTGIQGNLSVAESGTDVFEKFQSELTAKYGANVHYSTNSGYLFGREHRNLGEDLRGQLRQLLTGETTARKAYQQLTAKVI